MGDHPARCGERLPGVLDESLSLLDRVEGELDLDLGRGLAMAGVARQP
jgi:hypothetical protein